MSTNSERPNAEGKCLWHIVVDIAYEGKETDSCQDGVNTVFRTLSPLFENGSGFKQVLINRLPETDRL
jgi:hypothetical protein